MQKIASCRDGWIVLSLPNRSAEDLLESIIQFLVERGKARLIDHIDCISAQPSFGMFYIEADAEVMNVISTIPWIKEVQPHPSITQVYSAKISSDVRLIGEYIKGLKLLLQEHLLRNDVIDIRQRPNKFVRIKCTRRAADFLRSVSGIDNMVEDYE